MLPVMVMASPLRVKAPAPARKLIPAMERPDRSWLGVGRVLPWNCRASPLIGRGEDGVGAGLPQLVLSVLGLMYTQLSADPCRARSTARFQPSHQKYRALTRHPPPVKRIRTATGAVRK